MSGKTDKKAIFKLENDAQFEKLHQRLYDDLGTVHGAEKAVRGWLLYQWSGRKYQDTEQAECSL